MKQWSCWSEVIGKRVMVYTPTYHIVGTVERVEHDALGVAWGILVDAKQVDDERTPGQIVTALDLGTVPVPSTSVVMGPRVLPNGYTEEDA